MNCLAEPTDCSLAWRVVSLVSRLKYFFFRASGSVRAGLENITTTGQSRLFPLGIELSRT